MGIIVGAAGIYHVCLRPSLKEKSIPMPRKDEPPSIIEIFYDSREPVYQGVTLRIYCDSSDPETAEEDLTCKIWIRPTSGSWVVSGETMSCGSCYWSPETGNNHYYDWTIPTSAATGHYDVMCTVSDGALTDERTDFNEFQVHSVVVEAWFQDAWLENVMDDDGIL